MIMSQITHCTHMVPTKQLPGPCITVHENVYHHPPYLFPPSLPVSTFPTCFQSQHGCIAPCFHLCQPQHNHSQACLGNKYLNTWHKGPGSTITRQQRSSGTQSPPACRHVPVNRAMLTQPTNLTELLQEPLRNSCTPLHAITLHGCVRFTCRHCAVHPQMTSAGICCSCSRCPCEPHPPEEQPR